MSLISCCSENGDSKQTSGRVPRPNGQQKRPKSQRLVPHVFTFPYFGRMSHLCVYRQSKYYFMDIFSVSHKFCLKFPIIETIIPSYYTYGNSKFKSSIAAL